MTKKYTSFHKEQRIYIEKMDIIEKKKEPTKKFPRNLVDQTT